MKNYYDKKLYEILEKKYEKSLENFIPDFVSFDHAKANDIVGKINTIKKKKKITVADYKKLSSLMSKFLFYIKKE